MPELPEVETVIKDLEKHISFLTIENIDILYPNTVIDKNFKKNLISKTFKKFIRRGKYLIFELDDTSLVCHLRMEGKFFIRDLSEVNQKHDCVIFYLSNNKKLVYNDVRKFGRLETCKKQEDYKVFKNLGVEPLLDDLNFTYFKNYVKDNTTFIKTLLLDQSFIAGIGNIYADEILFDAKVHPLTTANLLSDINIKAIISSTKKILKQAIKHKGTTIKSFKSFDHTGGFQNLLKVHTKKICPVCKSNIQKIRVNQRGTHFCLNCQKKKISIAITGYIASGKSQALNYLNQKGFKIFDADFINSNAFNDINVLNKLKQQFKEVFNPDFDKAKLSKIVFNDFSKLKKLESITYPYIIEKLFEDKRNNDVLIAEIPLLFEKKFDKYFDYTISIILDKTTCLKRLKERNSDKYLILKKAIDVQISNKERIEKSSFVIYNNKSLENLYDALDEIIAKIC